MAKRQVYLFKKDFEEWRDNHFSHLVKRVARIEWIAWGIFLALIGLVIQRAFWG